MNDLADERSGDTLSAEERSRTWIVIAAFNEGRAIRAVVEELKATYSKVLVVDDGSSDDTAAEATAAGSLVLRHLVNLGQGAALQTGIEYAYRAGATAIVTFDADGQHKAAEIPRLVRPVLHGEADIVLGSRFLGRADNIKTSKIIVLKLAIVFTAVTTGAWFTDVHNGFRCLSFKAAQTIRIRQNRMAHASEILEQIIYNKLRYIEKPVTVVYTDYSVQKGQRLSNSVQIVVDLILSRIA